MTSASRFFVSLAFLSMKFTTVEKSYASVKPVMGAKKSI